MMGSSRGRRSANFERIKANLRAQHNNCYHCGGEIDYTAKYPDPKAFTVDHLKPLSLYPELAEDPGNLVASCARCNAVKGARQQLAPGLGNLSESW